MKKTILGLLSVLILITSVNVAYAKVKATSPETAQAIKYYKSGNYTQAYVACSQIVKKDPSNALAQYYLAMTYAQLGKKEEAIYTYDKVIGLSDRSVLGKYAKKGKRCLEQPSACHEPDVKPIEESPEDRFIKGAYGSGFSEKARGVHEREKIENLKREINRNEEMSPDKFRGYKDFSSYAPTNDEVVAAIRTLQRAGIADSVIGNGSDMYNISGAGAQSRNYDIINMLYASGGRNADLDPQIIRSLLSTQMSANF